MLDLVRAYLLLFGVVTIAGGVIGFVRAKSTASLVAGGISGGLLVFAAYAIPVFDPRPRTGLLLGLVVSLALAARFGMAFRKTRKAMPAGLIAALAIAGVLLTAAALVSFR